MTVGNAMLNRVLRKRFGHQPLAREVKNIVEAAARLHQCIWLDPSDLSTMYQDAAGTIPVTAVGQPVGKIIDKSGSGNHAIQTVSASRPTLMAGTSGYYLAFDGVDDYLVTPSVNLSNTDKFAFIAGLYIASGSGIQMICESSTNYSQNPGAFELSANEISSGSIAFARKADAYNQYKYTAASATPKNTVIGAYFDFSISAASAGVYLRENLNSAGVISGGSSQSKSAFGNYPIYIGRRGGSSAAFSGRMYGLCLLGGSIDVSKITKIERYIAQRLGVQL